MSQDIVADALNQMMNGLRSDKKSVSIKGSSKLLNSVLAIAKLKGYVKEYKMEKGMLHIEMGKLNKCNAIKPRYMINADDIDRQIKRYLPAKELGIIIISTSKGLMTHQTAQDKGIGGSLIAYFY